MPDPTRKHPPVKLTKGYVDRIKPGPKDEFHWDTEAKGFGLKVSPVGKLIFIVQGRVGSAGNAVRITVGPYGVFTVEQARDVAREHLRSMRMGVDPRQVKKADEAAKVTLQQVCDAYVSRPGKLKATSRAAIERHVRTTFEDWAPKPIASITEEMCKARYRKILTKGLRGDREQGSPGQANQAFSVLGALINFAMRGHKRADGSPLIASNPALALKDDRVQLKPRTSRIPDNRVGAVWSALRQWRAEAYTRDSLAGIDLVMFLLLTGCRLTEATTLTWDQVHIEDDPEACWWHLPDAKNRNSFWFPLSTQAIELLKTRERVKGSPWVFTTWSQSGHIVSPRDLLAKVSKVAGTKVTAHDLRRTHTTIGIAKCNIDFYKVELLTGHLPTTVTARHYLETERLGCLYKETQTIADWIAEQAVKADGANVVALRA